MIVSSSAIRMRIVSAVLSCTCREPDLGTQAPVVDERQITAELVAHERPDDGEARAIRRGLHAVAVVGDREHDIAVAPLQGNRDGTPTVLEGIPEIAEQIFDLPIRRGSPTGVGGLADHVSSPTFSTGVGLTLYGYRNFAEDPSRAPVGAGALVRVAGRLRGLFKEFF